MSGSVGVVVVVGVVWVASLQGGQGLSHPHQSPRWTLLAHAPTGYEEEPWEAGSAWPEADHYHQPWGYSRWLQELSLEPRLGQVLAPLTYQVDKRARVSATGPAGAGNKETTGGSQTLAGRAAKRGIGLFSLAIALAQKPTSPPEPMMHPADLSAYPRRARFFVATMG